MSALDTQTLIDAYVHEATRPYLPHYSYFGCDECGITGVSVFGGIVFKQCEEHLGEPFNLKPRPQWGKKTKKPE